MIDRRLPGLVLLLLAAGLYGGIAVPSWRGAGAVEAELARLRAEGEGLRRRLAEGEPQRASEEAWRQAGHKSDGSVTGLRRLLLQAVAGAPVTGVRLSVEAPRPPLPTRARIAALGSFSELVGLSERLIGPRTGVVPDRLRWTPAAAGLTFELDGVFLAPTP
jgi:hypothetical protein